MASAVPLRSAGGPGAWGESRLSSVDPGRHIGPAFRNAFGSWRDLRGFLAARAAYPEFTQRRALQQIVMSDIASRLPRAHAGEWVLTASLALPARVPQGRRWPGAGYPERPLVDHAHVVARPSFDIDLYPIALANNMPSSSSPERAARLYSSTVSTAVQQAVGEGSPPGLGGLARYSSELRALDNGKVMGQVHASPLDERTGRLLDDPVTVEIDVSTRSTMGFAGPPEQPRLRRDRDLTR